MANYSKKYRMLSAPRPRDNGSGLVGHLIVAIAQLDPPGVDDYWFEIPNRKTTINVPAATLQAALAQPTNALRVAAYKDALAANLNTLNEGLQGWDLPTLEALLDANDEAVAAADAANTFITVTLGQSYPLVDFSM